MCIKSIKTVAVSRATFILRSSSSVKQQSINSTVFRTKSSLFIGQDFFLFQETIDPVVYYFFNELAWALFPSVGALQGSFPSSWGLIPSHLYMVLGLPAFGNCFVAIPVLASSAMQSDSSNSPIRFCQTRWSRMLLPVPVQPTPKKKTVALGGQAQRFFCHYYCKWDELYW